MTLGERIKMIRKEKGLTQKQLALKLNTSPQNLAQYENGKRNPKRETLQKIADALEIPLFKLAEDTYIEEQDDYFKKMFSIFSELDKNNEKISEEKTLELVNDFEKFYYLGEIADEEREKWALQEIGKSLKKLMPIGIDEAVHRVEELTHLSRYCKPCWDSEQEDD